MLFIILIFQMQLPEPQIIQTNLYERLDPRHVVANEKNHLFLINSHEKVVEHYDENGQFVDNIGSPGNGPGQYLIPFDLFVDKEFIYIHDFWLHRIIQYDLQGRFIQNITQPTSGIRVLKVKNGWVYIKFGNPRSNTKSVLAFTDNLMDKVTILADWEKKQRVKHGVYNPALDTCLLTKNYTGDRVYFYKPGEFEIFEIQVEKRKIRSLIKKKITAFPFDKSWGREQFLHQNSVTQSPLRPVYPDSFPTITQLTYSPWGKLWVVRGNRPDLETTLEFDLKGNYQKIPLSSHKLGNLLAWNSNYIWWQSQTDEEQTTIYRYQRGDNFRKQKKIMNESGKKIE